VASFSPCHERLIHRNNQARPGLAPSTRSSPSLLSGQKSWQRGKIVVVEKILLADLVTLLHERIKGKVLDQLLVIVQVPVQIPFAGPDNVHRTKYFWTSFFTSSGNFATAAARSGSSGER
jgi:hypothetical protein